MRRIIERMIDLMTQSNPHHMVLKGGTALAYHHLNWHRDSEDIDLDSPIENKGSIQSVKLWISTILEEMVEEGTINSFEIQKEAFSNRERFHMKIRLKTYKDFTTKIDIDFKEIGDNLEHVGELGFYSPERMLVLKLNAFTSRFTLKDIYDISYLLKKVDPDRYSNRKKLAEAVGGAIDMLEREDIGKIYDKAFSNIDLRLKNLNKKDIPGFQKRCIRDLKVFRNQLMK
jgi:predicted nucleotidyltransferase component of viral defense system